VSARPTNNRDLVDDLCAGSGALREMRRVHMESFGNLIPHVFMGDVLGYVGRCMAGDAKSDGADVEAILRALEGALASGDRETRNVISISFARDAQLETFFTQLKPLLGARLRAMLDGK
jgi:hypothetical protein